MQGTLLSAGRAAFGTQPFETRVVHCKHKQSRAALGTRLVRAQLALGRHRRGRAVLGTWPIGTQVVLCRLGQGRAALGTWPVGTQVVHQLTTRVVRSQALALSLRGRWMHCCLVRHICWHVSHFNTGCFFAGKAGSRCSWHMSNWNTGCSSMNDTGC